MVDLLLVHPPKYDYGKNIFKSLDSYSLISNIAPLGLLYVAASCRNHGYNVRVLDMESEKISFSGIKRYLRMYIPRAVGVSVTSPLIKNLPQLSKIIKEERDIPVIVGGPFATLYPEIVLKDKFVDFVIRYEGEESLPELLKFVLKGEGRLIEIKNLSYRMNGKLIHNKEDILNKDIDSLPFPARELLPVKSYFSVLTKRIPSAGIIGSRGCPYRCIFCSSIYKTSRLRSVRNVVDEIEIVIKRYNIRNFDFFDPVFNLNNKWIVNLCEEILKRNLKINWRVRCRPDLIDKYSVIKMKEAGCHIISLSIESSNNETLKFLKKGYSVEDVTRAIAVINSAKINIHGYFILGCPNETKQNMLNTINFAKESKIDYADFHILTPFFGSELFEDIWKNKMKIKYDYDDNWLNHPTLNYNDIKRIYIKALCLFYFRPSWITKELVRFIKNPRTYINIVLYFINSILKIYKNILLESMDEHNKRKERLACLKNCLY